MSQSVRRKSRKFENYVLKKTKKIFESEVVFTEQFCRHKRFSSKASIYAKKMVVLGEYFGEFGQNIQKALWNHELQKPQCFTDVIFRCVDGELPAHYFILKEVCDCKSYTHSQFISNAL